MIARIFKPTFTIRRTSVVLGITVGGLVFPAASMAATHVPCSTPKSATCQIKTTPIHKGSKGFQFTLFFHQGQPTGYGGRYPNSIQGILFKHNGNATENDNYSFSSGRSHSLTFSTGKSTKALQFATIKGTFAKGRGSVNLTFHATGSPHHVKVPKGCQGQAGTSRTGTLGGTYTLKADKLGTITQKSFKATISTANYTCSPKSSGYDVTTLLGNPIVDIFKSSSGKVTESINNEPSGSGWVFDYGYKVTGLPGSDYTVQTTSNLKKATINGGGGISGKATYSSSHSSKHRTVGNASGSLAVNMASIGNVKAFPKSRKATQTHS
ncbi:MAG TPA: hypothetical protein VFB39_06955 [Solirubrobacteraceae bacterium]|nr:hypothetical protein [Solirubrobacteraceae bacterium]